MENDTDTISQIICNIYKENLECLDNHVFSTLKTQNTNQIVDIWQVQ